MFGLGPSELVIIALIVLLFFGARRLPEIGKGLGGAIREFKKVKKDLNANESADAHSDTGKKEKEQDAHPGLEAKVTEKVLGQVPGFKKAMDVKKKAEKIKELVK